MKTEYDTQAETSLATNGLKMRITLRDTKTPAWDTYQPMKKCSNCKGGGRKLQGFPLGHHQTVYEQERGLNKPIWAPCPVCNGKGEVPDPDALKHGHHYRVTLSRTSIEGEKETRYQRHQGKLPARGCSLSRITFDFFGSIADAEKNTPPTPYSVLACISSDAHTPETFKDWCDEYGDDPDSLKALQTFRRCNTFAKRLRVFFTSAELDQLSEIQ